VAPATRGMPSMLPAPDSRPPTGGLGLGVQACITVMATETYQYRLSVLTAGRSRCKVPVQRCPVGTSVFLVAVSVLRGIGGAAPRFGRRGALIPAG
jgi:hypothetical protein